MNKSLIELLKEISTNPEHQKNLAKCKSKEEVFKYCSSICQGYTPEELNNFILNFLKINKLRNENKENTINDGELKKIYGGIQRGTLDQLEEKSEKLENGIGLTANLINISSMAFFEGISQKSPQEMLDLTMNLAKIFGFE